LEERKMTTVLFFFIRLALWVGLAPLLPGIINKVKAWVAGRKGPPVLQLYYDLDKLWKKGVVMSDSASPAFIVGPAVAWVAIVCAAMLLPLVGWTGPYAFRGDVILMIYLLAVARFSTTWAAMETGSAFEGMGSAREVSYAVISEAATISAMLTLVVQSKSISLGSMLSSTAGEGAILLAIGLFLVLLAENCRVPFDDPCTHLELTMIHEAMILDHSGPPLAAILHGASVKLMLFSVLLVETVLPLGDWPIQIAAAALAIGVPAVVVCVGMVESLMARLAFRRVPLLLTTAFLMCFFALLVEWNGGVR
jgi:formate hydrogenlyase subunit 4